VPMGALLVGVGAEWLLHLTGRRQAIAWAVSLVAPLVIVGSFGAAIPLTRILLQALLIPAAAGLVVVALRLAPVPVQTLAATALAGIALATAVQFRGFYGDYLGKYQDRLAVDTDGDMRGVLERVIEHAPAVEAAQRRSTPVVYLGFRLGAGDFGFNYW